MAFITKTPDYADLDLDFFAHPTTGDIVRKTGPDAIKRSLRNLILTNYYDRPFRSYVGSSAQKILFDNANALSAGFLKDAILETIKNFEPRVQVQELAVEFDYDANGYNVTIQYIIIARNEPVAINLFLERIR